MCDKCKQKDILNCGCAPIDDLPTCDGDINSSCVVYDSNDLQPLGVVKGTSVESIVKSVNKWISKLSKQIRDSYSMRNVGDGIALYKGQTIGGINEFKTLTPTPSMLLIQNTDSVSISVSDDWFRSSAESFIKSEWFNKYVKDLLNQDWLVSLIESLTDENRQRVLKSLKISDIIGNSSRYNIDVTADKSTLVKDDYDITLTVKVFDLFKEQSELIKSLVWTRVSDSTNTETWNQPASNGNKLKLSKSDFGSSFIDYDITFKVECTLINGVILKDDITFTKTQKFSSVQISTDYTAFSNNSPDKIKLTAVATDVTITGYKWYLNNDVKGFDSSYVLTPNLVEDNKFAYIKLEATSQDGSTYTDLMSIPKFVTPKDGEPGVPGQNGYTWIKYSDNADGSGMIDSPLRNDGSSLPYIGMAFNKHTSEESTNPSDYTWSKYLGPQGTPGQNGYVWIKYSRLSNGRKSNGDVEIYDTPWVFTGCTCSNCDCTDPKNSTNNTREDMVYMGLAYNKQSQDESLNPDDYTWSKIKGDDGNTGYVLDLSNDNTSVPYNSDGTLSGSALSLANTSLTLYYGNDIVKVGDYKVELTGVGLTYEASESNTFIQVTSVIDRVAKVGIKILSLNSNKILATGTFSVTKLIGLIDYEIQSSTGVIKVSSTKGQTAVNPSSLRVKIMRNDGSGIYPITDGKLTYRYVYSGDNSTDQDGDKTMDIDTDFALSISKTNTPVSLELRYFKKNAKDVWTIVDSETIPIVKDGISGTYVEFRYGKTGSFTNPPPLNANDNEPAGWSLNAPDLESTQVLYMTSAVKDSETMSLIINNETNQVIPWRTPVRISGPQGPKGDPSTSSSGSQAQIVPRGKWKDSVKYKANSSVIDAVYYTDGNSSSWYTAIQGVDIVIGDKPTDSTKWNKSQENYDFIATGLFLANTAWIDNLGVRNLTTNPAEKNNEGAYMTNPKRVEITGDTSTMSFYNGSEKFTKGDSKSIIPSMVISSTQSYDSYNSEDGSGANIIFNRGGSFTTRIGTEGLFCKNSPLSNPFTSPSSGLNTYAAIIGFSDETRIKTGLPGYNGVGISAAYGHNVAIAGVSGMDNERKSYGTENGAYFSSAVIGSRSYVSTSSSSATFETMVTITDGSQTEPGDPPITYDEIQEITIGTDLINGVETLNIGFDSGMVSSYAGKQVNIVLPKLKTISEGWNLGVIYETKVMIVNKPSVKVYTRGSGNKIYHNGGFDSSNLQGTAYETEYNFSIPTTGRQLYRFYWDGSAWNIFGNG